MVARAMLKLILLACALLTLLVGRYLYLGTAAPGIPTTADVSCPGGGCKPNLQDLGDGRWRISVTNHGGEPVAVTLKTTDGSVPGVLLVRGGATSADSPNIRALEFLQGGTTVAAAEPVLGVAPRQIIPIAGSSTGPIAFTVRAIDAADVTKPVIVAECGLFRSAADINAPFGLFHIGPQDESVFIWFMQDLLLVLLTLSLSLSILGGSASRYWAAAGIGLALACSGFIILLIRMGPEWGVDPRVTLAGGTLLEEPGANLNYGMYMAQGILSGHGPTILGTLLWARMPGYGYFVALGMSHDLLTLGLRSIFIQLGFIAIALNVLVLALARLTGVVGAVIAGAILALMPASPYYTYIEAVIPGVACLTIAAVCHVLSEQRAGRGDRLLPHVLLHASFALWFSFRTDVLIGWAIVTVLLYAWPLIRWWYVLIPIGFFLAVGVPFGLFKQSITGDFSMTTTSTGASFMAGLWDTPNNPFVWKPDSDDTYFGWAKENGFRTGTSKAANDWAVHEVALFWVTYPLYMISVAWNKFMRFLWQEFAPGYGIFGDSIGWQNWQWVKESIAFFTYGIILVGLSIRHRVKEILLLGWIGLFNAPIFFLTFSSLGRFYNTAPPSLVAASVVLLADQSFYARLVRKPVACGSALAIFLCVLLWGQSLADWMTSSDRFRFALVLLDPAKSTLAKFARPLQMDELPNDVRALDLAALVVSAGVTRSSDATPAIDAPAGVSELAAIDASSVLQGQANCRVHVLLSSPKAISVGAHDGASRELLSGEPIFIKRHWWSSERVADFNLPVPTVTVDGEEPLWLYFRSSASNSPASMRLMDVSAYDCSPLPSR